MLGTTSNLTAAPFASLTAAQTPELEERVARIGQDLEHEARLTIGKVTVGPHA